MKHPERVQVKKATLRVLALALKICIVLALFPALAAVGLSAYFGYELTIGLRPVTNAARYVKIKSKWPPELVTHFPEQASRNASFHFRPGYLQGGSILQLQEDISPSDAEAAISRLSAGALDIREGEKRRNNDMPVPLLIAGNSDYEEFPADFTIMTLKAESESKSEGSAKWNHANTAGVAVSAQRGKIVYWAEEW